MYIAGFIDDKNNSFSDYTYALSEYGIELICTDKKMSKSDIYEWILENKIEFLFIDHKLIPKYDFVGTELLAYLNQRLPDMYFAILTSYKTDSLEDKLVSEAFTIDRKIFNEIDLSNFAKEIIYYIEIFRNRLKLLVNKYEELFDKRKTDFLTFDEEEELKYDFKILKSYGEIDEIPIDFLNQNVNAKLDKILMDLDKVLKDD